MIAPFHAEGVVSWEIQCVDDSNCARDEWTLSGGWKLETDVEVPFRLPLASHPTITAYRAWQVGRFVGEAARLAQQYFEPMVKTYQAAIDPTNWCSIMPRQ
jgi:hypothetical protein